VNEDAGALNEMKARLGNDQMKITGLAQIEQLHYVASI